MQPTCGRCYGVGSPFVALKSVGRSLSAIAKRPTAFTRSSWPRSLRWRTNLPTNLQPRRRRGRSAGTGLGIPESLTSNRQPDSRPDDASPAHDRLQGPSSREARQRKPPFSPCPVPPPFSVSITHGPGRAPPTPEVPRGVEQLQQAPSVGDMRLEAGDRGHVESGNWDVMAEDYGLGPDFR
jgi:hypothetical protein